MNKKNNGLISNSLNFCFTIIIFFQLILANEYQSQNLEFYIYISSLIMVQFLFKKFFYENFFLLKFFNNKFKKIKDFNELFNELFFFFIAISLIGILIIFIIFYFTNTQYFLIILPIFLINGFLINFLNIFNKPISLIINIINALVILVCLNENFFDESYAGWSLIFLLVNVFELLLIIFILNINSIRLNLKYIIKIINFRVFHFYKKIIIFILISEQVNIVFLTILLVAYFYNIDISGLFLVIFIMNKISTLFVYFLSKNNYFELANENDHQFSIKKNKLIIYNLFYSILLSIILIFLFNFHSMLVNFEGSSSIYNNKKIFMLLPIFTTFKILNLIIFEKERDVEYPKLVKLNFLFIVIFTLVLYYFL